MRARNLAAHTREKQSPPVSAPTTVAPPQLPTKRKVQVQELLATADFSDFEPALRVIKRLRSIETDRDGLIDLRATGVQILASPELLLRGVALCDAVLKGGTKRGWLIQTNGSPNHLRVSISGEQFDFVVDEITEPIPGQSAAPGGRRPRRPTGKLRLSLGAGYEKASTPDKRGTLIESKMEAFFEKGEALAASVIAERARIAAQQREYEIASRRRWEIEGRIRRLNENMEAWEKAERIRRYAIALADTASLRGPIDPGSDLAKWLAWAKRYADWTDPLTGKLEVAPQEFWD